MEAILVECMYRSKVDPQVEEISAYEMGMLNEEEMEEE